MWAKALTLSWETSKDYSRNNCSYVAAGIAYWALFSLFPLSLAAISIIGFLYPTPLEQGRVAERLVQQIPVSGDYLAGLVAEVARSRGVLGALAVVGLLLSGAKVFASVRRGINHAWNTGSPHTFLVARGIDLVLLLATALLAILSVAFTTNALGLSMPFAVPEGPGARLTLRLLSELATLIFAFWVFALLYRFIPNTRVVWRDIWLGALLASVLFTAVRFGLIWFVVTFNGFNLVYGSLGTFMAVLAWAYFSSQALMWGAQVSATYSRLFGTQAPGEEAPGH